MEDFIKTFHELMHAPKLVRLIIFSAVSLFVVVALVVIDGFICAIRQDRYLRKHYFAQWKLRRGTWRETRNVVIPDDPFFSKLTEQSKKVHRWIMIMWFVALLILSLIITFS